MSDRPGEMDERDVDERFASIVAGWEVRPDEVPDAADAADAADLPTSTEDDGPAEAAPRPAWVNPSPLDRPLPASTWRVPDRADAADADDAADAATTPAGEDEGEEHFEPPAVQLPPQEDLHFWGAVLGLVAGPLCLVYVAMVRPFHSTRWFLAGLALSLVGFTLLVLRQPRERDEDDDGTRI